MSPEQKLAARIAREQQIAKATIKALLDAGYMVAVYDGETIALKPSFNASAIFGAMFSVDEEHLFVHNHTNGTANDQRCGWVFFVYGNDGWDAVCDYTTNLEEALKPVSALADKLCEEAEGK